MQKITLPTMLQLSLKQHADNANIPDDEDLRSVMLSLSALHEKVEALKIKARLKK